MAIDDQPFVSVPDEDLHIRVERMNEDDEEARKAFEVLREAKLARNTIYLSEFRQYEPIFRLTGRDEIGDERFNDLCIEWMNRFSNFDPVRIKDDNTNQIVMVIPPMFNRINPVNVVKEGSDIATAFANACKLPDEFDKKKIIDAITKAMDVTEAGEDIVLAAEIAARISKADQESMSVEDIQDRVEMELMNSPRKEVAKKYIAYRNQRNLARTAKSREIFQEIIEAQATDVTRENANMNADTPAGMMMKFASESTKSFVDECLLSEDVKEAVQNGYIHIHDKDYYPTKSLTCVQHPLDKILKNGFFAGHGESRPAKRIETASILGCISMETVQNEMHGGQAIPAFDFYMAPFVRKAYCEEIDKVSEMTNTDYSELKEVRLDDYIKRDLLGLQGKERVIQHAVNMTVSRVHQSMEAFVHNMNS